MSKPDPSSSTVQSLSPGDVSFDPISPFCHDVLGLFRGPFAQVRFPDLDRSSLEGEAQALLAAQLEVESLERALDEARQRTREAGAVLTASATRALAYARVFTSGQPVAAQPALEAALAEVRSEVRSAVRAPAPTEAAAAQKKKRTRKDHGTAELLPMEGRADPSDEEHAVAAE